MNRPRSLDAFSLAAHQLAVARLREKPARLREATEVLQRWRRLAAGPSHCDTYWDAWEKLLNEGTDAVEAAVCHSGEPAATLRSASPLGRFISVAERNRLLREAREAS